MSFHFPRYQGASLHARLAAFAAALITTASVGSALLLAFHTRAPEIWLAPTPELMEMAAICDRHTERKARERCVQAVAAARLTYLRNSEAVARR